MKAIALTLVLLASLVCLRANDANGNPDAPKLISLTRKSGNQMITLKWTWEGPLLSVDVFQIMRRINGTNDVTQLVGLHKLKAIRQNTIAEICSFEWISKKADPTRTYSFSVIVFTDEGTSLESNSLTIAP